LTSQLRVKLGTMRPPIRAISMATTPIARRRPRAPVSARPIASKWIRLLAPASRTKIPTTGRFFHLAPATISRRTAPAKTTRKATSMTAAAAGPISSEAMTAKRPASHSPQSAARRQPWIGSRPVQLGTAVERKPVIAALSI
jgi:hypothetical protein